MRIRWQGKRIWINLVLGIALITMSGCKEKTTTPEESPTQTKAPVPAVEPVGAEKETVKETRQMSPKKEFFGQTPDGKQVDLYTLVNTNGLKAKIINYGAILVSLEVPDRDGNLADITLGYDN
ncbi:hypothetical protein ACFL5Z_14825, partial [Planctomycetota bacterium]